jgi:outer membrane protein
MLHSHRLIHSAQVLYVLFPFLAHSQQLLSLEECMQQAFKSSNILRMADLGSEIALEKLAQSRSSRMPSLTAKSSYLRVGKVSSFSIPMGAGGREMLFQFGTQNRVNADVSLAVPLFTWGRIAGQIDMALIGTEISASDRRQKALEVTDQVLRAYYGVLINRRAIAASAMQVQRAEKNLAITQSRFQSGHASRLEELRARVQAVNARTQLEENRGNLEKSNVWLAKAIGREGDQVSAGGEIDYIPLAMNADSLISQALATRHDLLSLGLQESLINRQIELTGNTLRPTMAGVAAYSVQNGFSPMSPDDFVDNWNVGVQLSFPLYDGGMTSHRVQEGKKQLASFQLQEKEIRELAAAQIRQGLLNLEQSEQKYLAQKENIELAREALASAEEQYQLGLLSSLDLIAAQQALAESELMVLRALFSHTVAKLDLCKAAGDYRIFAAE